VIESESNRVTELVENAGAVSEAEVAAFRQAFAEELTSARLLVLIGTLPPGLPPTIYREMTAAAVARGLPVIVDAQGAALRHALEAHPLLVKPNRHELGATLDMDCRDEAGLCRALSELRRRGATWAAISDGPGPVSLSDGSQWTAFPPPKIAAGNPLGSGDAMTSGIAAALLDGAEMPEALRHGIACGAANAAGEGYARLDPKLVESLCSEVRAGPWKMLHTA
jgi:1-phosphofructokinase family hexose kinase